MIALRFEVGILIMLTLLGLLVTLYPPSAGTVGKIEIRVVATKNNHCRTLQDMTPGWLDSNNSIWKADSGCVFPLGVPPHAFGILTKKRVLVVGDSQLRDVVKFWQRLFQFLKKKPRKRNKRYRAYHSIMPVHLYEQGTHYADRRISFYWKPSLNIPTMFPPQPIVFQRSSDVIINVAMSDMGRYGCGVETFYKRLNKHIAVYKESLGNSTTTMTLFTLQWVFLDNDKCSRTCQLCNNEDKLEAFREAQQLSAACNKIRIFDTKNITRSMHYHSRDGVHMLPAGVHLLSNLLVNYIVDPEYYKFSTVSPISCSEEPRLLAKWAANPMVSTFCNVSDSGIKVCTGNGSIGFDSGVDSVVPVPEIKGVA